MNKQVEYLHSELEELQKDVERFEIIGISEKLIPGIIARSKSMDKLSGEFVLVIQDENVGDEFDVYGFAIYEKNHYLKLERELKSMLRYFGECSHENPKRNSYYGDSIEVYFGTNESQFYYNEHDYAWKYVDISLDEKVMLERIFGLGASRYSSSKGFFWLNRLYEKCVEWITEGYDDQDF